MPPRPSDAMSSYGPRCAPDEKVIECRRRVSLARHGEFPELQVLDEAMQIGRVDPEQPRGGRVVAAGSIDGVENQPALGLDNRAMVGRGGGAIRQRGRRV